MATQTWNAVLTCRPSAVAPWAGGSVSAWCSREWPRHCRTQAAAETGQGNKTRSLLGCGCPTFLSLKPKYEVSGSAVCYVCCLCVCAVCVLSVCLCCVCTVCVHTVCVSVLCVLCMFCVLCEVLCTMFCVLFLLCAVLCV